MVWKTPNINIGGVPIIAQRFSWALTAGVLPFKNRFLVSPSLSLQLEKIQNPTYIELKLTGGVTGNPDPVILRFENIYLLEPQKVDPYHVSWELADSRYSWRGLKLYCNYNKTRAKNQIGVAVAAAETEPAALRKPFEIYAIGRYLPWSVKLESQKPYNMQEIAEIELKKLGIPVTLNPNHRGAYVVENVLYHGTDIYIGIQDILHRSRLNLGIRMDGSVYVYSVDFFDDTQIDIIAKLKDQKKLEPQILYRNDLKRVRPKKINVRFQKQVEVRVIDVGAGENFKGLYPNLPLWSQKDIDNRRVIGCRNVMPVPYETLRLNSKPPQYYKIGEWVLVDEYIRAIGLSDFNVRTKWHVDLLEKDYARKREIDLGIAPSLANEQVAYHIISAIRQHYRQTYQFDSWIMDRIESWNATRTAVINNYDHYSPKSPLFSDYCVLPVFRYPGMARRTVGWDRLAYNWIINEKDPYRRRPTLGTVTKINQQFGIFRIEYPPLVDMHIKKIYPFALDPLPYPSLTPSVSSLKDSYIKKEHTLETIISVVWSTDTKDNFSGRSKYYNFNVDFTNQGGIAPRNFDYLSKTEYARIPIKELNEEGKIINNPDKPINEGLLQAIANSESAKIINSLRDRYVGIVTLAGAIKMDITGNIKYIRYNFIPKSGLSTTINMAMFPPDPTLVQTLPQKAINFLEKQVDRAGKINALGGD